MFTEEVKEGISHVLTVYKNNCVTLASTTEPVTLPTALSVRFSHQHHSVGHRCSVSPDMSLKWNY